MRAERDASQRRGDHADEKNGGHAEEERVHGGRRRPAARTPRRSLRAHRAGDRVARTAPSRTIAHSPDASNERRSTTVDGVPASSPPSRTRSAAARMRLRDVVEPSGRRRRRRGCAELWSTGRRTPASGASGPSRAGTRRPSASGCGPQASGNRPAGFGSRTVTPPGSSARKRRAGPRAQLGQRLERAVAVEEHHRRGLVRPAALERVQPSHGLGVVRVAGEAVDRVGREHGDAADRHAAAERLGVGPQHDAVTTRSMPARSRIAAVRRVAGVAQQRRHVGRLPGPHLEGDERRARRAAPRARAGGTRRGRPARRTAPRPARSA